MRQRIPKWSLENSAVAAELKRFIGEKCAQVRSEARAPGHEMGVESQSLFTAAENGDWPGVFDSLEAMHEAARERQRGSSKWDSQVVYPVEWAAVNEIGAALEEFAASEEKYAIAFARDIIASIRPGSIYFGGTESGRFLITALSKSHVNADPFFTLTQNALVDVRSYLRYVRGMYGSRIYIPTDQDASKAFNEYREDLRRRRKEGKLVPGEDFEEPERITEIHNQIAVMGVNGLLSNLMFERNPDREFYVEQGFPLNWMYPRLSPNGLIFKINRQELPELGDGVVQRDREYWRRYVAPMIGDWLSYDTSPAEIAGFVERVHLNKDLSGFEGDPAFVRNEIPQKSFSHLRCSIGGLYAWRGRNSNSPVVREGMLKEADLAFKQAFALCPGSAHPVFQYAQLLAREKRIEGAILVTEAAVKLEEAAESASPAASHQPLMKSQTRPGQFVTQLAGLLEQLKRMRSA